MRLAIAHDLYVRLQLFEKLRERPLTHDELHSFCTLIFGVPSCNLPHPKRDWNTFYYDIETLVARESRQWNPLAKRTIGWIDVKVMAKIYGGKREQTRLKAVEDLRKQQEKIRKNKSKIKYLEERKGKVGPKHKKLLSYMLRFKQQGLHNEKNEKSETLTELADVGTQASF